MPEKLQVTVSENEDPSAALAAQMKDQPARGNTTVVAVDPNAKPPAPAAKQDEEKLIFGKYKTMEEAEKGHKELEAKLGAPKGDEKPATKLQIDQTKATPEQEAVQKAGLDLDTLTDEFAQNGKLSDDAYTKLEAAGVPKAKVDAYIEGQKAIAEKFITDVRTALGGKEKVDALFSWATSNLSEAEIEFTNSALRSGNVAQATMVLQGLDARYTQANGQDGKFVSGRSVPVQTGPKPFKSTDEMVRAMSDPRYSDDESYRQEVYSRANVSFNG